MARKVLQFLIGVGVTRLQRVRRLYWRFTRPPVDGVHAAALTPAGELVLVRLTYAEGWRLPGGGRCRHEHPRDAAVRELREEIGLLTHGPVEDISGFMHEPDFRRASERLFIVRDVQFRPKWLSLEVADVRTFPLDALPPDVASVTARQLEALGLLPET